MSRVPWHLRKVRTLIYVALIFAILGVAVSSALDAPDATHAWVEARELYGLWALSLLLTSMLAGPLSFVLPWVPLKAHLILGRKAIGVSAFVLAVSHVACYLGPTLLRNWSSLFSPGRLWIAGLLLGLAAFADMATLAITSRRKAIRRLGPHRWKRLHRSIYLLLPATLLHATFVGADFGVNKGPDVITDVDAGCLVTMLSLAMAWLILLILRKKRLRWTPAIFRRIR
ncbi:MAG: ferric reductase-like transmembrane domain-containing protein [Acidobacteriota bacterium]